MLSIAPHMDVYLCPRDRQAAVAAVVAALDAAVHSIEGINYSLNHPAVIAALHRARARGIAVGDVGFVLDQTEEHTEPALIQELTADAIPFQVGKNPLHQIIHLKCFLVDGRWVLAGSLNYTTRGDAEDNILMVIDSPELASDLSGFIAAERARLGDQKGA